MDTCPKSRVSLYQAIIAILFLQTLPAAENAAEWKAEAQPNLAEQIKNAKPLEVENVSQPTQTTRLQSPVLVPNPGGGTPDVLVAYYKGYQGPATVFATDSNTGEVTRSEVPRGRNTHVQGAVIAGNGKLYSTLQMVGGGLELWVYDPVTNRYAAKTVIGRDLNLFGQGNRLTTGPGGLLYGTVGARADRRAAFYRIDPATDKVEVLGTGTAIQSSPYPMSLTVADNGNIYSVYGKTPYRLIEFDPGTKQSREIATANPQGGIRLLNAADGKIGFSIVRVESGVETDGTYIIEDDGSAVRTGDAGPGMSKQREREGSKPGASKNHTTKKSPTVEEGDPTDKKRQFRRLLADGLSAKEAKEKILGSKSTSAITTGSPRNRKQGIRPGGIRRVAGLELDTALLDPSVNDDQKGRLRYRLAGQTDWRTAEFDPPLYGEAVKQLIALPDGRIFGTATNRAGHFVYHPKTDQTEFLGRTGLEHHSSTISGNRVYLSGYPSSTVWSWDFSGPEWVEPVASKIGAGRFGSTASSDNPRKLGALREFSGVHFAYSATTDFQGRVYFSGRWYRDGNGGGLGWWYPASEQAGGFWEPLSNLQVTDCCAVAEGRIVALATLKVGDKVLNREAAESAQLCLIDTREDPGKIAKSLTPIPGAISLGLIAPVGGNRLIGVAPDPQDEAAWLLYGVDVVTGKTAFTKTIPGIPPNGKVSSAELLHTHRSSLTPAPDGTVWMIHLGVLIRIHPGNGHLEVIGRPVLGADAVAGFTGLAEADRKTLKTIGMMKADGAPATVGRLAFSGDDLYLTGTPWLRRIPGVVNRK